jgi:hypothetical protein
VPLSNVAPAMVISLISLAYVEEDGLLLSVALLAAITVGQSRMNESSSSMQRFTRTTGGYEIRFISGVQLIVRPTAE